MQISPNWDVRKGFDWESSLEVTKTGMVREAVNMRLGCDKGLALSRLEAPLALWNILI